VEKKRNVSKDKKIRVLEGEKKKYDRILKRKSEDLNKLMRQKEFL